MHYRENQWQVVGAANPNRTSPTSDVCCFPYTKQVHKTIQVRERLRQVMSSASVGSTLSVDDLQSKLRLLEHQQQSLQWRTQSFSPNVIDPSTHASPTFSRDCCATDSAERQDTNPGGIDEDERDETPEIRVETTPPFSAPMLSKRFLKRQRLHKKKRMVLVPNSILETPEISIDFLQAADQAFHRQVDEIMRDVRQM
ncbi:hypothetical protein MPSEU_000591700 [Mayamaea pseudoterrestris]|nr:hypothetical protein MPSEU_000591700 [Mayamaea pseudoterrestris]